MSALAERVPSTLLVLWRKVRQLLPVYAAIADSFGFSGAPCADVSTFEANDEDVLLIAAWIEEIDALSQPHHLRSVLQELDVCSSDLCVSTWLQHFISKPVREAADRDKIDFLLSHYVRTNLPPSLQEGKPNYAAMKAVLEPVLGTCEGDLPEEAREVDEMIGIAERCRSLAEFEHSGIIRRGRELKLRAGELYFTPPFLLAFTHFNAVVRRECHRLMNSDLKFIGDALDRLELQGITHIDCTAANWSANESVKELKNKWATWELIAGDYSQDFFANLIAFRSSVEEALDRCIELSMTSVSQELRSIHALLLEMRSQIDELPRKFGTMTRTNAGQQAAHVPVKPLPVPQPSAKPAPVAATEKAIALPPQNSPKATDTPVAPKRVESAATIAALASEAPAPPKVPAVVKQVATAAAVPQTLASVIPAVAANPKPAAAPEKEKTAIAPAAPTPVAAPVPRPPAATTAPAPEPPAENKPSVQAETKVSAVTPAPIENPVAQPRVDVAAPMAMPANKEEVVNAAANPAAPTAPADAANASATPATVDIEDGIARLQKTLSGKRPAAVSIAVAGTRILLTGTETSMFSVTNDRFAHAVQRAVMMRIFLVSALETHSKTRDKSPVAALVPAARTEYSAIKELVSESKSQKLAREEEVLSATAKQLAAMLERAERIAR